MPVALDPAEQLVPEHQRVAARRSNAEVAVDDLAIRAADADLDDAEQHGVVRSGGLGDVGDVRRAGRAGLRDERLHQPPGVRRTAPSEADPTSAAYRPSTPLVADDGGRTHSPQPSRDLGVVDVQVQRPLGDVDRHQVAVADDRERTAARRLGRHVADHEPARHAGEPAVRDERDRLPQPDAHHRGRDAQHLAHARPAGRPLVAHDQHVALVDRAAADGGGARLLAVEHAGRPGLRGARGAGELDHRALRRQVAVQREQQARRLVRRVVPIGDVVVRILRGRRRRRQRAALDGRCGAVDVPAAHQFAQHRRRAADPVEVLRHVAARRRQARHDGRPRRDVGQLVQRHLPRPPRGRSRAGAAARWSTRRSPPRRPSRCRSSSASGSCATSARRRRRAAPRAPPPAPPRRPSPPGRRPGSARRRGSPAPGSRARSPSCSR